MTPAEHLPDSMREIAELVGVEGVLALIERWGGVWVHVPHPDNLHAAHPLVLALGAEPARRMAERYPGERVEVPIGHGYAAALLAAEVAAATDRGESEAQIARRLGITARWVRELRRRARETADDGQVDLFADG